RLTTPGREGTRHPPGHTPMPYTTLFRSLETWDAQTDACGVNVRYNAEPVKIEGEEGNFTITLKDGDKILSETIVMAIGTQGNPNLMRCPGGDNKMVQYQLDDPGEYYDEHITVIGSGDAGIENARSEEHTSE